jgi:hypothetical protein
MTIEVGNIVISFLSQLTYIDKLAGVIKVITKTDLNSSNSSVKKTFPVACGVSFSDCINTGNYKHLMPDSSLGCIVYLEDNGVRLTGTNGAYKKFSASYKLVCWINQKKLGYDKCSITSDVLLDIISKFKDVPVNFTIPAEYVKYNKFLVEVDGQDPKSYNPFSKFSYDEDKTQYLMHPYDYFSLNLTASFEINSKCLTPFEKQTPIPC